ncbi:hypothetical protein J8F10_06700 [Gemmata sp. G18]|uniref:Uncharacterized protein n=1 Tax=Gemmata palustris TaxID=2822762 RepID=A0ABS5BMN3_9BACT|nr:hypothetical protein [Gemmata palustris]MBP3954970.1 hypothetical protein [Gemmata palustris]
MKPVDKYKVTAAVGWYKNLTAIAITPPPFIAEKLDRQYRQGEEGPAWFGYRLFRAGSAEPEVNLTNLSSTHPPELFDETGWLLAECQKPDVARIEVLFWNPAAAKGLGLEKRLPARSHVGEPLAVLSAFTNAVADSLHPPGPDATSCEWAVLEVTPAK